MAIRLALALGVLVLVVDVKASLGSAELTEMNRAGGAERHQVEGIGGLRGGNGRASSEESDSGKRELHDCWKMCGFGEDWKLSNLKRERSDCWFVFFG